MRPLAEAYPWIGSDRAAFLERLKRERALELFSESVRWPDLKRWADLETQDGIDRVAARDPDFNNYAVGEKYPTSNTPDRSGKQPQS